MASTARKKPSTTEKGTTPAVPPARERKAASTRKSVQNAVPDIRTEVIDVTPELATEWLASNPINRPLRESTVELYMRDMIAGRWVLNGESIKRDYSKNLLDGQHRLEAVKRSGVTVKMLVVLGLPPETQESMDAGMRRAYTDNFALKGEVHTSSLSSVARRVVLWEMGAHNFKGKVSFGELKDILTRYPEIRRSAEVADRVYSGFRFLPPSSVGTAHFLMSRLDVNDATWFFGALEKGVHLDEADPVYVLRERAMMDKATGKKLDDVRAMAYLVAAWNAKRTGKRLSRQVLPVGAAMPLPV